MDERQKMPSVMTTLINDKTGFAKKYLGELCAIARLIQMADDDKIETAWRQAVSGR
jgi:hypothetical protein